MRTPHLLLIPTLLLFAFAGCAAKQKVEQKPAVAAKAPTKAKAQKDSSKDRLQARLGDEDADIALVPIYFEFDSAKLRADSQQQLKKVAGYMKKNSQLTMTIEGHCDDRGTSEYNLALGDRRARATSDYLAKLGVQSSRIHIISYGEERPAQMGKGEDTWAKNRRAEFVRRRG